MPRDTPTKRYPASPESGKEPSRISINVGFAGNIPKAVKGKRLVRGN